LRRVFIAPTSRRDLLRTFGLGGAALALGACDGEETDTGPNRTLEPSEPWNGLGAGDDALYPEGIQSGDPTPDGAVLWTRYVGTAALGVVVATWDDSGWIEHDEVPVTLADGGFVHHEIDGLEADQHVAFQFRDADNLLSPVARFHTAPDPYNTGRVRFAAFGGCRHQNLPFASMSAAANRGPLDFALWMGDTIYADPPHTLEGYRATWAENFVVQGFRDLFAVTPSIAGWDDHEVANNWDQDPPEPEMLAAGTQAFFEHAPMRRHRSQPDRLWRSFRYGHTVEVFVLDCRGERIFREQYISPEQMAWLKQGLATSTATWKVIVNSVPITNMPGPYDAPISFDDRWEAYPEERAELLDFITDNDLQGILFIGGDFHQTALTRIEPEGPANRLLEFITGAVSSNNNLLAPLIQDGEQFPYSDAVWSTTLFELTHFGYARITVVDDEDETVFDGMIDTSGNIIWYEMIRAADQR